MFSTLKCSIDVFLGVVFFSCGKVRDFAAFCFDLGSAFVRL